MSSILNIALMWPSHLSGLWLLKAWNNLCTKHYFDTPDTGPRCKHPGRCRPCRTSRHGQAPAAAFLLWLWCTGGHMAYWRCWCNHLNRRWHQQNIITIKALENSSRDKRSLWHWEASFVHRGLWAEEIILKGHLWAIIELARGQDKTFRRV